MATGVREEKNKMKKVWFISISTKDIKTKAAEAKQWTVSSIYRVEINCFCSCTTKGRQGNSLLIGT